MISVQTVSNCLIQSCLTVAHATEGQLASPHPPTARAARARLCTHSLMLSLFVFTCATDGTTLAESPRRTTARGFSQQPLQLARGRWAHQRSSLLRPAHHRRMGRSGVSDAHATGTDSISLPSNSAQLDSSPDCERARPAALACL